MPLSASDGLIVNFLSTGSKFKKVRITGIYITTFLKFEPDTCGKIYDFVNPGLIVNKLTGSVIKLGDKLML